MHTSLILLDSLPQETCSPLGNHHNVCHRPYRCLSPPLHGRHACHPPHCRAGHAHLSPPSLILTLQPSSLELEPLPLELQDLEPGLDQCSDLSSLDTPGTLHSSSSFSHTLFWDSPCPRPWVCSV